MNNKSYSHKRLGMSLKEFFLRRNKIHIKILVAFLGLIIFFAVTQTVISTRRMTRVFGAQTTNLLRGHSRLLNEVIKEYEDKVAFYAQFMADVTKLSDELADTSVGRSVLIYLLESLKKDRIRIRLYREFTRDEGKKGLIRKGLLGIRTTALLEGKTDGKAELVLAAVAPIERAGGIKEVIIAEYPLDYLFLQALKRKTGADFALIHEGRLYSSTFSPHLQKSLFVILDEGLRNEVLDGGITATRQISDTADPQKIAFSPISINFRNQGIYVVSESLKQALVNRRRIILQNTLITVVIFVGLGLLYYIIVRRITDPIEDLSLASRKVAEGDLGVSIKVKTKDEVGELGRSFNLMVDQLRQSQEEVKGHMDELSRLYKEVSEERNISKSILDNLTNGLILFDADQRVVLINPTAEEWLGVRREQVTGMQIIGSPENSSLESLYVLGSLQPTEGMAQCWKYFNCNKEECPAYRSDDLRCWFVSGTYCRDEVAQNYPDKLAGCKGCDVYQAYCSALEKQKRVKVEELQLKRPQRRILKVSLCPIFDDHGKFLGLINVFDDVTSEREIDRLKTEFVSLVSHELRTPLSSIKAYAEILLKKPDRGRDQQVEFLNIINEETDRLTRLINDILNISKIEERKIDLERKSIDVFEMIDKSVSAHRSHAEKKGIHIKMHVQKDVPKIWGDEDTLRQVLANLLNNAVKYTPEGGAIQVSAACSHQDPQSPGEVVVRVKDNGIGIPSEHLERVFDRFHRIDRPFVGGQTGTGLGLYFCRYIVERHGGRIWAESDEGKGSTLVFTLPVAGKTKALQEPSYVVQGDDLLRYSKEAREKISVLVVDDDARIRNFLKYHMEDGGFKVFEADNGSRALDLATKIKPSVILLDTVMPGIDGYEVLEALNQGETTKHIPVIVLSGAESSKVAMELGAAGYLMKPIAREALINAVHDILSKAMRDQSRRE